jgi:FHS family L-fucose permease-like MFS transporter
VELTSAQVNALKAAGTYSAYLQHETARVTTPYIVLGCVVLLWALLLSRLRFPELGEERVHTAGASHGRFRDLLQYPHFVQAVIAQFFYVGAQVGTWSFFIQYVQQYTKEPEKIAGYLLTGTLVAFAVGRFSATYLMRTISASRLMGVYSLINVVLVAMGVLFPGWLGMWSILLTSFFMSLMFPTIFALGLKGIGPNTKLGGSLIVMAIVGGAVFTPLMGLISEATASMAKAMMVPLLCYLFIAYFAFVGSKVRTGNIE